MSDGAPFLFGKHPSQGDFIRLGAGDHDAWDYWVTGNLAAAKDQLGEDFEAAHLACPPLLFVAGPGDLGPGWRAGAATPSMDAAGRRFMLVAGLEGLDEAAAGRRGDQIARRSEQALYDAMTGAIAPAAVLEAVASVDVSDDGAAGQGSRWWVAELDAPLAAGDTAPPRVLADLMAQTVSAEMRA